MKKPELLRQALNQSLPYLADNPEKLGIFIDSGTVVSTLAKSLSWEYRYTLNIIVMEYPGDQNLLIAPILLWLREHQPDIMANNDVRNDAFRFEADILNNLTANISVDIKLTERVIVSHEGDRMRVEAVPEPDPLDDVW